MKKTVLKILSMMLLSLPVAGVFAGDSVESAKNLLKYDFSKLSKSGVPLGYTFFPGKDKKGKISVSGAEGVNVVKLERSEQGRIFIDSAFLMDIKKNKKYVLTVQLKIENQKYTGKGIHFFYVCAYNTGNNKHIYNKILGHGGSGGWMTVVLVIDTVKEPLLAGAKLLIRGYGVSGTYFLKKPMLVKIPNDIEVQSHYILENEKTVPGGLLRLGTIKK